MATADSGASSGRIVVGIDGSANSTQALRWAVEEARLRDVPLQIVYAWQGGLPGMVPTPPDDEFKRHAEAVLDAAIREVAAEGLHIDTKALKGHPAAVLVEASAGAALVVVGSHGHGGFAGTMLGSVSQRVASHAHCPVAIIRPRP